MRSRVVIFAAFSWIGCGDGATATVQGLDASAVDDTSDQDAASDTGAADDSATTDEGADVATSDVSTDARSDSGLLPDVRLDAGSCGNTACLLDVTCTLIGCGTCNTGSGRCRP